MNQILENLEDFVAESDPPSLVALWGIGGAGKSQMALRYAEMKRNQYDPIIWINAQSPETAAKSYADAFEALDLDFPTHAMDQFRKQAAQVSQHQTVIQINWVIKAVMHWLEIRGDEHCKWLVIIDQADDLRWIHEIMPRGRQGSVIITSRDHFVDRIVDHAIEVGMMNTEEAVELLFRAAGTHPASAGSLEAKRMWRTSQEQHALAVVHALGYLPLAIDLAGAYISQNDYARENISRYMDYFAEESHNILGASNAYGLNQYTLHVETVWETSFTAINESHPLSAHVFLILAHLNHAGIEDRLFLEASLQLEADGRNASAAYSLLFFIKHLILIYSGPIIFWYLKKLVLENPYLVGRKERVVTILLVTSPVILDSAAYLLTFLMRAYKIETGDTVRPVGIQLDDEDVVFLLLISAHSTLGAIVDWLFPDNNLIWTFRLIPLQTVLTVLGLGCLRFLELRSTQVPQHIKALLEKLDLSETSRTQFNHVLSGLQDASSSELGWRFVFQLVWDTIYLLLLSFSLIIASYFIIFLWIMAISYVARFLQRRERSTMINLSMCFLCLHRAILGVLLYLFGWWVQTLMFGRLWHRKNSEFAVDRVPLNNILSTVNADRWNSRPFSEAMTPLTRLSLVQRNSDRSYVMHPLVQWWARQRIPKAERKAWIGEAERLLNLACQSRTCWKDVNCQQMMVPHLIEVASAEAARSDGQFSTLNRLLNMVYRSLKIVGRSHA